MPYKKDLQVEDIENYLLPEINDFIENLLNLYEICGSTVKLPVGYPAKKEINPFMGTTAFQIYQPYGAFYQTIPSENDFLQGKYQDEAILLNSANRRLYIVSLIKKLGGINDVHIDNPEQALVNREMVIFFYKDQLIDLYNKIEFKIEEKKQREEKEKQEARGKTLVIHYDIDKRQMECESKTIDVSGLEETICRVVFSKEAKTSIELGDLIYELTGEIYQKSQQSSQIEKLRQATYRLNDKILKEFNLKDFFKFSTKKRLLTVNRNDLLTKE
ncbi:MAG: hypothetical protein WCX69_02200 [Candidatus Paceibacterota bacterium]